MNERIRITQRSEGDSNVQWGDSQLIDNLPALIEPIDDEDAIRERLDSSEAWYRVTFRNFKTAEGYVPQIHKNDKVEWLTRRVSAQAGLMMDVQRIREPSERDVNRSLICKVVN